MTRETEQFSDPDAWCPVEVRAWRRGCRPTHLIALKLARFDDDFDFDASMIANEEVVEFHAFIPRGNDIVRSFRFAFPGCDNALHWIDCDPVATALEVRSRRQQVEPGAGVEFGMDGDETGVFFPEDGAPVGFGRVGQPSLSDILSGSHVPVGGVSALSPDGSFQVDGDEPDFEIRNATHDKTRPGAPVGAPVGRSGISACLPPNALVVTPDGMLPLADVAEGEVLRTTDHGWQRLNWLCWPVNSGPDQPVFLATESGVPISPSHSVGRMLLMTGRFSSRAARQPDGPAAAHI